MLHFREDILDAAWSIERRWAEGRGEVEETIGPWEVHDPESRCEKPLGDRETDC